MKIPSPDDPNIPMEDVIDIIPKFHLIYPKLQKQLTTAIVNLSKFYGRRNEEGLECNCDQGWEDDSPPCPKHTPYQYKMDNQNIFRENIDVITNQLARIDPLVIENYTQLYNLENLTKEQQQEPVPVIPAEGTTVNVNPPQKKESKFKGILDKFRGNKGDSESPYRRFLPNILNKELIKQDWYDILDFHRYMILYAEAKFLNYSGLHSYLLVENTEFERRVNRLITSVSEGMGLILREEKRDAREIISSTAKMTEKHRGDFPQPSP